MAPKSLIPKQRLLTESETQSSFDSWVDSMCFQLAIDEKAAQFFTDLKNGLLQMIVALLVTIQRLMRMLKCLVLQIHFYSKFVWDP